MPHHFRGDAHRHGAGADVLEHEGAGPDQGAGADLDVAEDGGARPQQHAIACTGVSYRVVWVGGDGGG